MKTIRISRLIVAGATVLAGVAAIKWLLVPLLEFAGADSVITSTAANVAGAAVVLTAMVMLIRDSFRKDDKEEQNNEKQI